jgi:hypothetical protein
MPEWLNAALPGEADIPDALVVGRLVRAAALGLVVAAVYFLTQRKRRAEAAPFVATLVLLTVLIAMVTRVIGESLARAFSLAGVLAIIRFRTVIEDTRDTAFVIAAVVVGMAVGTEMTAVALAGIPVLAVLAALLSVWGRGPTGPTAVAVLVVRFGLGPDPHAALNGTLARHLKAFRLVSTGTARQGAALDLTYAATLHAGGSALALIGELNRVEGVQGVEWKETIGEPGA